MLEIKNLTVRYGAITAVEDISLSVGCGEIVTLIGSNGAGKSTTLRAISGLVSPACGSVVFDGEEITRLPAHEIVRRKLSQSPEGRQIFLNLTVEENLRMGAYTVRARGEIAERMAGVFEIFPRLAERRKQSGGTLSGGEQQMLAIGRALMNRPQMLLLDEPSLGIAPKLVQTIFERIVQINRQQGITILLVEQNAGLALSVSTRAYVLEAGRIAFSGASDVLRDDSRVKAAYLGG